MQSKNLDLLKTMHVMLFSLQNCSARYRDLVTLCVFELVGHQTGSKSCLPDLF